MTRLIKTLAAVLALAGCAADSPPERSMNASVILQPQHTTAIGADATLRLERVEDSRCPPDVRCVWAGKISYHFSLTSPAGVHSFTLDPAAPVFNPPQLPGVSIALARPTELPVARPSTAAGPGAATPSVALTISRR